jgi:hypothetical protein
MDCCAFGGILNKEEDIDELKSRHAESCVRHVITYPLHSNSSGALVRILAS